MKYILLIFFCLNSFNISAQINLLKEASERANKLMKKEQKLSEGEISEALVEALIQASKKSVHIASVKDGFNNHDVIRIPFPEDARQIKKTLLKLGMSNQIKQFEESINRAAESASEKAFDIFISAIRSMTIDDAFEILNGNINAASIYLKEQTSDKLYFNFKPVIDEAIEQVQATRYWDVLVNRYNTVPFTRAVDTDLAEYITIKTINGLFFLIEKEEENIRINPSARVSDLLKRVFN